MTPQQHCRDEWEALQKAELTLPPWGLLPASEQGWCQMLQKPPSKQQGCVVKWIQIYPPDYQQGKGVRKRTKTLLVIPKFEKKIFILLNCVTFQKTPSQLYLTSHHLGEVIIGAEGKPSASINYFPFTGFSIINAGLEALSWIFHCISKSLLKENINFLMITTSNNYLAVE